MIQEDFTDAFIWLLSGVAELKGAEVKWKDHDSDVYIEFPDLTPTHAIVRRYWDNGILHCEHEWTKGLEKELWWYINGKKCWECNWAKGVKHGKESYWNKNGKLCWEKEWINGVLIK